MRWIRKLVILSLAGYGTYRLYELAALKTRRAGADGGIGDAIQTVKTTASQVKDAVATGTTDITEQVHDAVNAEAEPPPAVDADRVTSS